MKSIKDQFINKMTREELITHCSYLVDQVKQTEDNCKRTVESYKNKLENKKRALDTRHESVQVFADNLNTVNNLKDKSEAYLKQIANLNKLNAQKKKDFIELDKEYKFLKERVKEVFGRAIFAELLRHESNPRTDFSEKHYHGLRKGEQPYSIWTIYKNVKALVNRESKQGYFFNIVNKANGAEERFIQ